MPKTLEELRNHLRAIEKRIILVRKPGDPEFYGVVENSWSLESGVEGRTFIYFTGYGVTAQQWAEKDLAHYRGCHPDWFFEIQNPDNPDLPLVFNWELWLDAHTPNDNSISGVKNKHEARNIRFKSKGDLAQFGSTTARPMHTEVIRYDLGDP